MENKAGQNYTERFSSPEEELAYLRQQVAERERALIEQGSEARTESVAKESVREYRQAVPETVLHESYQVPKMVVEGMALGLSPEPHDAQITQLLSIMQEKGIKNALSVAESTSVHLADDLERFLVQYLKSGNSIAGLSERTPIFRALQMTLFEITLPSRNPDEPDKPLKELLSSMEQFYSGMMAVSNRGEKGPDYFTLELAVENHGDEFVFYAAVPDSKKDLFEKHILAVFHNAKISERKNDYNIFNETGVSAGSIVSLRTKDVFPIRTYDTFDHDPLNAILSSFSKIDTDGEGAAIQIVFRPADEIFIKRYKDMVSDLSKGKTVREALGRPHTFGEHLWDFAKEAAKEVSGGLGSGKSLEKEKKEKEEKSQRIDEVALEQVKRKSESLIAEVSIRIIASSRSESEASDILSDIESAFNQFENTHGNGFVFNRVTGKKFQSIARDFSFRLDSDTSLPLSLRELTTIFHLPSTGIKSAPQLKISKAATAPLSTGMPGEGLMLGVNRDRNTENKVFMASEDRLRHFYCIGQTGTGKTTLLKNMIAQDIANGEGVCFIDPHGTDIIDLLACVPPSRYEDVIYFDPGFVDRPMGLNMLEYDVNFPEQKTFVVNEMLSIFNKLFDMKTAGGPMFEQYFRNAAMLLLDDPTSGSTLIDLSRVLSEKAYRAEKLSKCKNPIVVSFWREVAEKAGGEASLQNIVPYITSKFDSFLSNDIMRPIIAQEKSSFNFREIMDNRKILLINLSKGRLGDINSSLLGLILVGKILMAALSRVDSLKSDTLPFYLYIDEFQNVTTDSISTILSEARKYRLSLTIAHQFIKQLDEKIKDSVFGNVGSISAFRVGAEDSEFLEKQFAPVFSAKDIMELDNRNAYIRMLVHGRPIRPFNIETMAPPQGNTSQVEKLKELSYLKYGRPRSEIEAEVMKRYIKPTPPVSPVPPSKTSPNL